MPAHGATSGPAKDTLDPFTRKTSVKKVIKGQKKQQGSSRFRTKGTQELTPLTLLKGMLLFTFVCCVWMLNNLLGTIATLAALITVSA